MGMIEKLEKFIEMYENHKYEIWKYNFNFSQSLLEEVNRMIQHKDQKPQRKLGEKILEIVESITQIEKVLFFEEIVKDLGTKIPVTVEDNLLKATEQWLKQIKKKYYNDEETNNSIRQIEVALNSRNLDEIFRGITFFLKDRHLRKGETPELEENPEVYEGYVIADMIALIRGYNNEITGKGLVEGLKKRSEKAFCEAKRRLMIYQTKEEVTKNEFENYLNDQGHWNRVYKFLEK